MPILKFLENNFSKLPTWARVVVYFFLTILFAYLVIAPRYITGQAVAVLNSGGYVPYRDADLQTRIGGQTMKFKTNSDGDWAIPIISLFPSEVRIQVLHVDTDTWHDVEVPMSDIWGSLATRSFRISVEDFPPKVNLAAMGPVYHNGSLLHRLASLVISDSHADKLNYPKDISASELREAKKTITRAEINRQVITAYQQVTGKPRNQVSMSTRFRNGSSISYTQRISVIEKLEKQNKLKIPDNHWKKMDRLRDISDYVYKRKVLEKVDPQLYKVDKAEDWSRLEGRQRPAYR